MLILSRRQDDSVIIGEDIEIKIISIDKGSVRLGFSAPSHCVILRGELKDAITSQNKQASQSQEVNLAHIHSLIKQKRP